MAFNPLVLKDEDIQQILKNDLIRNPPNPDAPVVYKAITDYEKHFKNILCDMERNMFPPSRDAFADYTSSDVRWVAHYRHSFKDNPEYMKMFDDMEKSAYADPEVQARVDQQGRSRSGFYTQNFMSEFAQKHNIEIPLAEWEKDSKKAYVQEVRGFVESAKGDVNKMLDTMYAVTNMMDAVDKETIDKEMNLEQFWKECGREAVDARARLEREDNPNYYAQLGEYHTPDTDKSFLMNLDSEVRSLDVGEEIAPHVKAGVQERKQEHTQMCEQIKTAFEAPEIADPMALLDSINTVSLAELNNYVPTEELNAFINEQQQKMEQMYSGFDMRPAEQQFQDNREQFDGFNVFDPKLDRDDFER